MPISRTVIATKYVICFVVEILPNIEAYRHPREAEKCPQLELAAYENV